MCWITRLLLDIEHIPTSRGVNLHATFKPCQAMGVASKSRHTHSQFHTNIADLHTVYRLQQVCWFQRIIVVRSIQVQYKRTRVSLVSFIWYDSHYNLTAIHTHTKIILYLQICKSWQMFHYFPGKAGNMVPCQITEKKMSH